MNYFEEAIKLYNNGQLLPALSYADIAYRISKNVDEKLFRDKLKDEYLSYINNRNYNKNKVAIYAITKNEIDKIDAWYNSIKQADYIVVLDTGSTDGSYEKFLELAKENSNFIVKQQIFNPWRFDLPRNIAMSYVPEDANILFSIDIDEVLDDGWYEDIISNWNNTYKRGTYKYIWSHMANGQPGRIFYHNKIHTWKWIWEHPVHESVYDLETNSSEYLYSDEVLFKKVCLQHWPKYKESRQSYLPLLEQRKLENETDIDGLIYLMHEYFYRDKYQNCIELADLLINTQLNNLDKTIAASCFLFKGDSYNCLGNITKAIESYEDGIKFNSEYRENYLELAKIYIDQQKYTAAIILLEAALKNSVRKYSWIEKDISWTYQPYDLLCLAYYYSGDRVKGLGYAYKAYSYEPTNKRLKDNIDECLNGLTDNYFKNIC